MSGHSKWHNIQAKKGAEDAKRGRAFTKITREIIIAAKAGGGNPETNSRLRAAVEKAKAAGMPNDNVKKAIMRGTGEMEGVTYEETTYEGYGPNGTAFIIMASTDNKNRTTSEIRRILSQHGGALGENGSVSWGFERKGSLDIDAGGRSYDDLFMIAVDSGAEDLKQDEESTTVITGPEDVYKVRQALEAAGIPVKSASLVMIPKTLVPVALEDARKIARLEEALDEHDDVSDYFSNYEMSDEIIQQLEQES
ncbi:MAG TPA: YebC/PmpR family DNA-binding transcriptional regulator [Candidatus Cryosericum sp.]|jgi:YebC/PmpR family DNA-binding regulatory protein|nr:YebC/PmpR family DNA-binding transcriptional regulator [Candidatus Cryosericum sp.]